MSRISVSTSNLYKAIAAIAEYLEDEFSSELFSFMDGGTTLELRAEALSQCQSNPHWQALAQAYESNGGSISSSDSDEWKVV